MMVRTSRWPFSASRLSKAETDYFLSCEYLIAYLLLLDLRKRFSL